MQIFSFTSLLRDITIIIHYYSRLRKEQWCLKCNKVALKSCISSSDHATFIMGPKSPQFCRQLQILKDENENQMAAVINKRKEAKQYYDELSKSLETVQDTVKKLNEENDLHLAEMVSLLESSGTDILKDESAVSLSKKLKESSLLLKKELKEMQNFDDHLKNTTITVHLNHREKGDLPSIVIPPISDGNPTSKSLLLASHLLLSEPPTSTPEENVTVAANSSTSNSNNKKGSGFCGLGGDVFNTYLSETSNGLLAHPGIDFTKSVFVMRFSQWGRTLGVIQIQPNFDFCRNFGHALGQFSLTSPKQFEAKIEKVPYCCFSPLKMNLILIIIIFRPIRVLLPL